MIKELSLPPIFQRWIARLRRYHYLWPIFSFASGIFSFFLINRQQSLGAYLALALLLTWSLLLAENLWSWLHRHRRRSRLPRIVASFCAQMTHQETLFFCLPFFLITTIWNSTQALFTSLLLIAALVSIIDPLYFRLADRLRWLYFAFHGLCAFVLMLVLLPLMMHLTTGESILLASGAIVIVSLPSLITLMQPHGVMGWLAMFGLAGLLSTGAWLGRDGIPPATLWIAGHALSPEFDASTRQPRGSMPLANGIIQQRGLYVYTSINAPRGLNERIYHVWRHDGRIVDRVPLTIRGGREQGYRAWSHKQNFPEDSRGKWRIDIVTDTGQRLGVIRFSIADDASTASLADGRIKTPPGISWLHLATGNKST
ncbi:DUF5924 family protein [Phytohalomonas tamaricis]|uniref:DUF5924 family protein n=1 Tax=Phytohalomonas tamaricis TaxID=2081032 RepID=UPI000D0AD739|nr:DUF5924 family protein [Phytohalomonas tamaricis]